MKHRKFTITLEVDDHELPNADNNSAAKYLKDFFNTEVLTLINYENIKLEVVCE